MKKNKIFIFIFMFVFFAFFLISANVNVEASTSDLIKVEGAQIRTSGTAHIRFVATVDSTYDKTNVSAYGVVLAYGEANANDLVIGATLNGKSVVNAEVLNLDENNYYYVNLVDIPDTMYGQLVTARAYVVDNGEIVYSDSVVVRSLSQVALKAYANGERSDLIDGIYNTIRANYKNFYVDQFDNVYLASSIYETVPSELEKQFVADWNNKFGTEWTEVTYAALQASAKDGKTPLADNNATDCSGTNMYEFFHNDEQTSAKWKWFLEYMVEVAAGKAHPTRQASALLGNGTYEDEFGTQMYSFMHLSASITNFFNGGSSRDKNNDIIFTDSSNYSLIESFNYSVYAENPNLVLVDSTILLDAVTPEEGYEFTGYQYQEISCVDSFAVVSESIILEPQFEPIRYDLKFYNGSQEITSLYSKFTIETDDFKLPSYDPEGYVLRGWYTTSTFEEGTQVTSIEKGTTGDITLYAKLEASTYSHVSATFDLNGGQWQRDALLENATISKKATLTQYLTYASGGGDASLLTAPKPVYWTYIVLKESAISGVYQIKEIVTRSTYITVSEYDFLITWAPGYLTDATSKEALDYIQTNKDTYVGQYVILENIPSAQTSSCSITVNFILEEELTKAVTKTMVDPVALPVPYRVDREFLGWVSSIDGSTYSTYPGYTTNPGSITYTAQYKSDSTNVNATVTFDYNGGATKDLYKTHGTKLTTLLVNSYNGDYWSLYANYTFISTSASDPTAKFSTRIYLALDDNTGLYSVVKIIPSGTASSWPEGADYVITVSDSHTGTCDDNFSASKLSVGSIVFINKTISEINASNIATLDFYSPTLSVEEVVAEVHSDFIMPKPIKVGYNFAGWYDDYNNKYESAEDFAGIGTIVVYAKWKFEDKIVGAFETNSWVTVGDTIQLKAKYLSGATNTMAWTSKTPSVATVDQNGVVKGVSEGEATIIVSDAEFTDISFTFYVTVFASDISGIVKVLAESNNASIYTRNDLPIGAGTPAYYYDVIGSVSKLLFEDYVVHKDFYLSSPSNKTTLSSGGVQFITVHYAADMPYSKNYSLRGGYNLASYNKSCNTNGTGASWHYSTGNDGVWACQSESWGTWHAGTSKAMKWYASGVTTSQVGKDIYTTDVTLGSDGYFYIKGVKTSIKNTTGYTRLNTMGLGVKLVGSQWYLGGCYYNSSYKYISSLGGNLNSIGIESSVREGSDLWLTWQYSAQLCAQLLLKYDLPIQRLVGHHFFSGKDCPQPMLEFDMEIWYEFVELVRQEMALYDLASTYSLKISSSSSYFKSNGRITSLPTYSECVKYTVTYTTGGVSKTVTLSTILPGTIG